MYVFQQRGSHLKLPCLTVEGDLGDLVSPWRHINGGVAVGKLLHQETSTRTLRVRVRPISTPPPLPPPPFSPTGTSFSWSSSQRSWRSGCSTLAHLVFCTSNLSLNLNPATTYTRTPAHTHTLTVKWGTGTQTFQFAAPPQPTCLVAWTTLFSLKWCV